MRLSGRGIVITGGSLGIGLAVAEACVREGADIVIAARNQHTVEQSQGLLKKLARPGQAVFGLVSDVADRVSVDRLVSESLTLLPKVTGVVNAAGINGPKGLLEETAIDEWVATIEVNLIGTMQLCRAFIPYFREKGYGKIVNFSGGGATSPHPRFTAYACSKVAVVRLTESLAQEIDGTGIDINAVAPGAVNTRMLDEVIDAGPGKVGEIAYAKALEQKKKGGAPPQRAAELSAFLLSAESDGISGKLISAVWDPWEKIVDRKDALIKSDVYTLRRILPEDRGMDWSR